MLVSISGTLADTVSFLIARYLAQDRILATVKDNKKFLAIDKAIGEDGFRVVTLLRLSLYFLSQLGIICMASPQSSYSYRYLEEAGVRSNFPRWP
jgi:uncharacterized membrane protein YdjX (TVP38/TMEM64 family)